MAENIKPATSFGEAVKIAQNKKDVSQVFVIVGASIYKAALESPLCGGVHFTQVLKQFKCDTFLTPFPMSKFTIEATSDIMVEAEVPYQFIKLIKS